MSRPTAVRPVLPVADAGVRAWLSSEGEARLRARLPLARRRAKPSAPVLVSVTEPLTGHHDPAAMVFHSRLPGEPWFCLEQPERQRAALGALGAVVTLDASGPQRFETLRERWQGLCARALTDAPDAPPGVGLVAVAGFAFADHGGVSAAWEGFGPASLVVPEVVLVHRGAATWITCTVAVSAGGDAQSAVHGLLRRLSRIREAPLPLLDPDPLTRVRIESPIPPVHYEQAVASAVAKIASGELEKVVLAREVHVSAARPHDAAALFGVLRAQFPGCFSYAAGRGAASFVGATPELLVRKDGMRASTVALAGSGRRSSDPAVDEHLGARLLESEKNRHENRVVAERIAAALAPHAVWVTVAPQPAVVRIANIQHLATPIRAQLHDAASVLTLAGALHPTPAVGGEPGAVALRLIPALEGLDRGWYAGTLGWVDAAGDGEFCVALRCALLRGRLARCYAGAGIVSGSDPSEELAETETKLQALLPALCGRV